MQVEAAVKAASKIMKQGQHEAMPRRRPDRADNMMIGWRTEKRTVEAAGEIEIAKAWCGVEGGNPARCGHCSFRGC
jgi:hypothetical protein